MRLTRTETLREPQTVVVTVRVRADAVVVALASRAPDGPSTDSEKRERAGARTVTPSVPSSGVVTVVLRLRTRALSEPPEDAVVGAVQGAVTSCWSAASAAESG